MYRSQYEDARFKLGLVGDCLLTRRLSVFTEPEYLQLREILNEADATFANLEGPVNRYFAHPFFQRQGGGTYMTVDPALLPGLRWLGVNMLACGSSHSDDYGQVGVMDTINYLDQAGIMHAGSGRHLAEARSPSYLDTANGRVALIAANAQFNPGARAGEARYDSEGHPGVNAIRQQSVAVVSESKMEQIRQVGAELGLDADSKRRANQGEAVLDKDKSYEFLNHRFTVGSPPGVRNVADERDIAANLHRVIEAREFADYVVVSLHCHEQGGPSMMTASKRSEVSDIADFAIDFGRRCIDAGADVFVAHGPQVPLGIEIYKGKPIFHGLGTFIFEIETIQNLPAEAYERFDLGDRATTRDFVRGRYRDDTVGHTSDPFQWRQMVATCDFARGELQEIKIHPIDLGFESPRSQRGRPMLVKGQMADEILQRVSDLSSMYGTKVTVQDGIGVIHP